MPAISFLGLQVSDLERSATFYREALGLTQVDARPDAIVFATDTIPFAVRTPLPGTDLSDGPAGLGVAPWIAVPDAQSLHDELDAAGHEIATPPGPSPFGMHFAVRDPDGYAITVHEQPA